MSRLKVYWPDGTRGAHSVHCDSGEPVILSFKSFAQREHDCSVVDLIARARTIYDNKRCPHCSHPVVEPIELADAVLSRNSKPIPGTATLVGFRCDSCQAEWPV